MGDTMKSSPMRWRENIQSQTKSHLMESASHRRTGEPRGKKIDKADADALIAEGGAILAAL